METMGSHKVERPRTETESCEYRILVLTELTLEKSADNKKRCVSAQTVYRSVEAVSFNRRLEYYWNIIY